jgi:hypothetical protein
MRKASECVSGAEGVGNGKGLRGILPTYLTQRSMVFRFEPEEHYGWQPNGAAKRGSFCRGRAFDGVCLKEWL